MCYTIWAQNKQKVFSEERGVYGYQKYRFGLNCTDMRHFVELTDHTFICTLKCTHLIVLLKIIVFFVFIYNKDVIEMLNKVLLKYSLKKLMKTDSKLHK
jgi:hypothetical protein